MEIDEVAARLVRRYWVVLLACVVASLAVVSLITVRQRPMYAADARIISSSVVPSSSAESAAIVSQVQGIATSRTVAAAALLKAGADRNLSRFIKNNVTVSGLGSSQVVDLTVTDRSPQVAEKIAAALAAEVTDSINRVGQSGLNVALKAIDDQIVRLSQQRAALAHKLTTDRTNQQLQARLAGMDEVIANFTGDRGRLLIQASTQGLAAVIDKPALPVHPVSTALPQKLGLAGLLGLVAGILIAAVAETIHPTVPGARWVSHRLGAPLLGQLSAAGRRGEPTPDAERLALHIVLAAARSAVVTVLVTDIGDPARLDELCASLQRMLPTEPVTAAELVDVPANGWEPGVPATAAAAPGTLVRSHLATAPTATVTTATTATAALRVYPLHRLDAAAVRSSGRAGLLVLVGGVTPASDVAELADLAVASGWPVLGVTAVRPPRRVRWSRSGQAAGPGTAASSPDRSERDAR